MKIHQELPWKFHLKVQTRHLLLNAIFTTPPLDNRSINNNNKTIKGSRALCAWWRRLIKEAINVLLSLCECPRSNHWTSSSYSSSSSKDLVDCNWRLISDRSAAVDREWLIGRCIIITYCVCWENEMVYNQSHRTCFWKMRRTYLFSCPHLIRVTSEHTARRLCMSRRLGCQ